MINFKKKTAVEQKTIFNRFSWLVTKLKLIFDRIVQSLCLSSLEFWCLNFVK